MSDACEIGRMVECQKRGHDPVKTPEQPHGATMTVNHTATGICWAETFFCRRCGLIYWEPIAPSPPPEKT